MIFLILFNIQGEINEEYAATLRQFNDQLDFVEEEKDLVLYSLLLSWIRKIYM